MNLIDDFSKRLFSQNEKFNKNISSIIKAHEFIDNLTYFLFPIRANKEYSLSQTKQKLSELRLDFQKLITPLESHFKKSVDEITCSQAGWQQIHE